VRPADHAGNSREAVGEECRTAHHLHDRELRRAVWEGLVSDKIKTRDEALKEIYKKMRPGDPPTKDAAKTLFENMFFNPERYSLSRVGRLKLDHNSGSRKATSRRRS